MKRFYKKAGLILILFMPFILWSEAEISVKLKRDLVIGGEDSDELFELKFLDVDEDGNIYTTDAKSFSIAKFSPGGALICKAGRKGEGPGEFPAHPGLIACSRNKIYVSLDSNPNIFIFDKSLKFQKNVKFHYRIFDFSAYKGRLFISTPSLDRSVPIAVSGENGRFDAKFEAIPAIGPMLWKQFKSFAVDQEGNYVIAGMFEDKIEKWNRNGALIWSARLFDGQKIVYKKSAMGNRVPDVKKCFCFRDIAVDNRQRIYVLAGEKSRNRLRDIYILSETGKRLGRFTIPHPTPFIKIDENLKLYVKGPDGSLWRFKLYMN